MGKADDIGIREKERRRDLQIEVKTEIIVQMNDFQSGRRVGDVAAVAEPNF